MSRTIIRKPAHRINKASHLRSFLVSLGTSRLLAMRRGEVDMLFRPRPRENSSVRCGSLPEIRSAGTRERHLLQLVAVPGLGETQQNSRTYSRDSGYWPGGARCEQESNQCPLLS